MLREENSALRKDNINLKEQVIRLRVSPAAKPPIDEPYRPMAVADKQIPMFYIATSIAVSIFCLLLGKYLLWMHQIKAKEAEEKKEKKKQQQQKQQQKQQQNNNKKLKQQQDKNIKLVVSIAEKFSSIVA